jgi:hypothetical protein
VMVAVGKIEGDAIRDGESLPLHCCIAHKSSQQLTHRVLDVFCTESRRAT